jgi:catechol 2,3-dioxygenase-like lactoylglutathione lyase family enzyme
MLPCFARSKKPAPRGPWHNGATMIQRLSHVTVYVLDQDRAHAFYTEKLGFEVRADVRMGDFRWLTVGPKGQPDLDLVLMPIKASPMMDAATADNLRALVEKGVMGGGVFETADIEQTHADLVAKGVTFRQAPQKRPYGTEALFKDDSGNWFSLVQR